MGDVPGFDPQTCRFKPATGSTEMLCQPSTAFNGSNVVQIDSVEKYYDNCLSKCINDDTEACSKGNISFGTVQPSCTVATSATAQGDSCQAFLQQAEKSGGGDTDALLQCVSQFCTGNPTPGATSGDSIPGLNQFHIDCGCVAAPNMGNYKYIPVNESKQKGPDITYDGIEGWWTGSGLSSATGANTSSGSLPAICAWPLCRAKAATNAVIPNIVVNPQCDDFNLTICSISNVNITLSNIAYQNDFSAIEQKCGANTIEGGNVDNQSFLSTTAGKVTIGVSVMIVVVIAIAAFVIISGKKKATVTTQFVSQSQLQAAASAGK